jgi:hypothetical protein
MTTPAGRLAKDLVQRFDASTFSGHSLRSGFLTSAAGKGASIFKMMNVSRHKSVDTLRGYVRDAELFKDHAGAGCYDSAETSVRPLRRQKVAGGATPGSSA